VHGDYRDALLTGTFALTGAFIGTFLLPSIRALTAERRRRVLVGELTSASRPRLRLRDLEVDGFVVLRCERQEDVRHVASYEFTSLHETVRRTQSTLLKRHKQQVAPVLEERARRSGRTLTNEPAVDMMRADISVRGDRLVFAASFGPCDYLDFATTGLVLDDRMLNGMAAGGATTLRQAWESHEPRHLSDVGALPCVAKVGTVTVPVTSDGLVCMLERRAQFVASDPVGEAAAIPVHFVGEGSKPEDIDGQRRFDPEQTARRGLAEELGLALGHVTQLVHTGLFFDSLRWQPVFCFLAHVDLDSAALESRRLSAQHGAFEAHALHWRPMTIEDERTVALFTSPNSGVALASNHAAVAFYLALVHQHGSERVDAVLAG